MCANNGNPRSRDRELRHKKKLKKQANFASKSYEFASNFKTTGRAKLQFGYNVGDYECFMQTKFGGAGHVTKTLQAEIEKKVDELEEINLGNCNYRY